MNIGGAEYVGVRVRRDDSEWHCRFELRGDEGLVRCGYCLEGFVEPGQGATCKCGAVVSQVRLRAQPFAWPNGPVGAP